MIDKRKLPADAERAIKRMRESGISYRKIQRERQVSPNTIARIVRCDIPPRLNKREWHEAF